MKSRVTSHGSRVFLCVLLSLFTFTLVSPALAQTSDEYYNKAVNKYFLGDNSGAIRDLNEALRLDPANAQARDLLQEIRKDSGAPAAPAPAVTAPAPAPAKTERTEIEELTKAIKKAIETAPEKRPTREKEQETVKPKGYPSTYTYYKPSASPVLRLTGWDLAWILTALLTLLYVALRYAYAYVQLVIEKRSIQVCTECHYANSRLAEFCIKCGGRLKPWVGITANQRKWYAKFNWQKNPFTLDIMPKLFTGYQTQVNTIFDKVYLKTGHLLVMGNKGVGKTTLLKWLAETLAKEFHTVYIPRPTDNFDDLLQYLAQSLKIKKGRGEKISIYDMEELVSKTSRSILLLLDEAHEFGPDFERSLRTLGDLNGVTFVLGGLMETREKIKRDSPPFFDRIIQEVVLHHLSLEETSELIRKRIEDAGGTGFGPFTADAIENIYKMTNGVPRLILKVCDWVITEAIHNNLETIEVGHTANFPQETTTETKEEAKS
ncbi:MAG: AAA family ATPase [Candidatus Margulisiibacteriota bacterium]